MAGEGRVRRSRRSDDETVRPQPADHLAGVGAGLQCAETPAGVLSGALDDVGDPDKDYIPHRGKDAQVLAAKAAGPGDKQAYSAKQRQGNRRG